MYSHRKGDFHGTKPVGDNSNKFDLELSRNQASRR